MLIFYEHDCFIIFYLHHSRISLSFSLNSQSKIKIVCRSLIFTSTDNGHQRLAEIRPRHPEMAHKTENHGHAGGGVRAPKAASAGGGFEARSWRDRVESIFLMLSISLMRMDGAAAVIYTNGDDKFSAKCIHCIWSSGEISGKCRSYSLRNWELHVTIFLK